MTDQHSMSSGVWVLRGLGNEPAAMVAIGDHLWLFTETAVVIDAAITTLSVAYPWHQFDGGCVITSGVDKVRVSFVRPNGAADVSAALLARADVLFAGAGLLGAAGKLADVRAGRKLGKAWKPILVRRG